MKKPVLVIGVLLLSQITTAQFTLSTTTPDTAVNQFLIGNGIISTTVNFQGDASQQLARYTYSGTAFPIDTGIMLSTGNCFTGSLDSPAVTFLSVMVGTPGYAPLDAISGYTTFDAAVLDFTFTPLLNTLNVSYIFGSEEYEEYVGSGFNDVFAFLLTGPDPAGGTYVDYNIALIPGGSVPVSINTVNQLTNSAYYTSNISGTSFALDGHTVLLSALAPVVPNQQYQIKLGIADVGDGIFDSFVFFDYQEFKSLHTTLGTEESAEVQWNIYRVGEQAYVQLWENITEPLTVDIISMDGKTVCSQQLFATGSYLDLSMLADGIYTARLRDASHTISVKKFFF